MRIAVRRAGLLTTIQDEGRRGLQALGVPPAGPMDWWSFRLANLLVGNDRTAAALEITGSGPELECEAPAVISIVGAEFSGTLDGRPWRSPVVLRTSGGSRIAFGERRRGMRAYLAVGGGLDVPPVLGSRSTDLRSRFGGFEGRALRDGDTLRIGRGSVRPAADAPLPEAPLPEAGGCRLRVLPGPEMDVGAEALAALTSAPYVLSTHADRMGFRLTGPPVQGTTAARLSSPVADGVIQAPPSGQPILLMVDRPTTGGYDIVGVVITADLPVAGQLGPGDHITFERCDPESALDALAARERPLRALEVR